MLKNKTKLIANVVPAIPQPHSNRCPIWITPRTACYIKLRTFGGTHSFPKTDHTCIGTRDETIGNVAAAILVWSPLLTEQVPWLIKDPHTTIKTMNIIQRNPNNQIYIILNKETECIQIQLTPLDNINLHTHIFSKPAGDTVKIIKGTSASRC